jgi:hypothetical protein
MKQLLAIAVFAMALGCRGAGDGPRSTTSSDAAPELPSGALFVEGAEASGLTFHHFNGMTGEFYYPEIMAPGIALLDYDNDGDLDVFITQGRMLGGKPVSEARFPPRGPLGARLFRNDLDGTGTLRFSDVTDVSRIEATGYGMGAAAADYDNDGCVDLYVTNLGPGQLWRNNCDGTFSDVTRTSGTASPGWGISAAFVDVDRDGWLDLFVGHYLNYSVQNNIRCHSPSGQLDYCPPHIYRALPSRLYRNNGNGTFTDATERAGMALEFGPAMGVSTADFDGDGWIDIYVANDSTPNNLWRNGRDGTFKNIALVAGVAVSPDGQPKASMGIDAGDMDNDGDEDLFITELTTQGVDLYVNDGSGVFIDESARAGLRVPTLPFTGFGAAWLDFDNDGLLDVATVNGLVTHREEALLANTWFGLAQRRQLFWNQGGGRFEEVSGRAGEAFTSEEIGRGAAFGDLDNDGDTDIVVGNAGGAVRLLINQVGHSRHWVGLRLVGGGTVGRDMLGARATITRADDVALWRRARSDGSYASANDPRVLAGLGSTAGEPRVRVRWPGGRIEEWTRVPIDRYTTLREGTGTPVGEDVP